MRVGLCFDGFYSIQEMIELSRLADEIGMESIWMSDHLCFRDSLTTCMALLVSTQTIKVAPAPMSPYSRYPIISAMSVATMDEFAPGRVIASPGTGNAGVAPAGTWWLDLAATAEPSTPALSVNKPGGLFLELATVRQLTTFDLKLPKSQGAVAL